MKRAMKNKKRPKVRPKKIDSRVGALLAKWETQSKKQEIILGAIWNKIVGERVAKNTRVDQIRGKKLIVFIKSAAWMNELTFLREKIKIEAKNAFSVYNIEVEDVVFKIGL